MNETINTILNRRSCRAYKPEQITQEELSVILECGLHAPSGMNTQAWHFTVVQNADLIGRMNAQIRTVMPQAGIDRMTDRNGGNPDFSIFYFAPTVIFMSGDENDGSSPMNVSYAAQNMCLAAESMNIGSCILGMAMMAFDTPKRDEFIKELGIPEGYKPFFAISFGYKNMISPKPERVGDKVNFI